MPPGYIIIKYPSLNRVKFCYAVQNAFLFTVNGRLNVVVLIRVLTVKDAADI